MATTGGGLWHDRISRTEVEKALGKTKRGRAAGPSGVTLGMFAAAGELGLEWLTELCGKIVTEGKIPQYWKSSLLVPVFEGEGGPLGCGSCRAIELLDQAVGVTCTGVPVTITLGGVGRSSFLSCAVVPTAIA